MPKPSEREAPARIDHQPVDPYDNVRPSAPGSCDEVSCVLTNYEGTCCTKFRPPRAPVTILNPSTDPLIDTLTRQSISRGIASVKARVAACADHWSAKGQVKVRVRVGADGLVTSVSVDVTPDPALGACVAAEVQRAVFPRTHHGGSFSYPFVF